MILVMGVEGRRWLSPVLVMGVVGRRWVSPVLVMGVEGRLGHQGLCRDPLELLESDQNRI